MRARDFAAEFEQFWRAYPRKTAKGDARKAWAQQAALLPPIELVLAAIRAQQAQPQWRKDEGQFVPYPATWLRAERWDDEVEVRLVDAADALPWDQTAQGIEARGAELGLSVDRFDHFPAFKSAVLKADAMARARSNVVPMQRRA